MLTKFIKPIFTLSLLTSLVVATFASANAGATNSAKRNWSNEVDPAYRSIAARHTGRDAFAAIGRAAEPVAALAEDGNAWRYSGGPKSPVPPSRDF